MNHVNYKVAEVMSENANKMIWDTTLALPMGNIFESLNFDNASYRHPYSQIRGFINAEIRKPA